MTAVEWLAEQLESITLDLFEQSKEMEKENQEEFAIGFVKWIKDDGREIELFKGSRTPKKLLEIYKETL